MQSAARRALKLVIVVVAIAVAAVVALVAFRLIVEFERQQVGLEARKKLSASMSLVGCASRGGAPAYAWTGSKYCRVLFPDGGKACTDNSQCKGRCLFILENPDFPGGHTQVEIDTTLELAKRGKAVGECQRANFQLGCFAVVKKGSMKGMSCVD